MPIFVLTTGLNVEIRLSGNFQNYLFGQLNVVILPHNPQALILEASILEHSFFPPARLHPSMTFYDSNSKNKLPLRLWYSELFDCRYTLITEQFSIIKANILPSLFPHSFWVWWNFFIFVLLDRSRKIDCNQNCWKLKNR